MTDRLVSLQAAVDMCRLPHMRNADCSDFEFELMLLPEAVIRCKDCKHYKSVLAHCTIRGDKAFLIRGANEYCSRAERREQDERI